MASLRASARVQNAEVIDLTANTVEVIAPVAAAAASAVRVASLPQLPVTFLLDDSSENSPNQRTETRKFKSDPNERGVTSAPRKRQRTQTRAAPLPSAFELVQVVGVNQAPPPPEALVLEVFPDAELSYVKRLLGDHNNDINTVIAHFADNSYPKVSLKQPPASASSFSVEKSSVNREWQFDYLSTESFEPSREYKLQAELQLVFDFPFLSKPGAQRLLKGAKHHYAVCHEKICSAVRGSNKNPLEKQYLRLLNATNGLKKLSQEEYRLLNNSGPLANCILTKKRSARPVLVSDKVLLEEIAYVRIKFDEWNRNAKMHYDRQQNKEAAERDGTGIECPCCCDRFDVGDMVACRDEGHLFCCDCLESFAQSQIFGAGNFGIDPITKKPMVELKCFHSDGCRSGFDRACLEKALPQTTIEKYDSLQFQISIENAALEGVATCPKCGYQAVLASDYQRIFACPVASCRFESCRECGEPAHIPLRCDEVEKVVETKGRLTVEEAITAAKIRHCPKCKKPFIKSDGCNKMKCACNAFSCYICRSLIKDYTHFCQTPHCDHKTCNKCPLWTKAEEDDLRAMREAGIKAAEQVHEKSLLQEGAASGNGKPSAVSIDVDSLLQDPTGVARGG